jgi:hypothetical protein
MNYNQQLGNTSSEKSFQKYIKSKFGTSSENYNHIVPHIFNRLIQSNRDSVIRRSFQFWEHAVDINSDKIESVVAKSLPKIDIDGDDESRIKEFVYSLQSYYALILNADRIVNIHSISSEEVVNHIEYDKMRNNYENLLGQPEDKPFEPWLIDLRSGSHPFNIIIQDIIDAPDRLPGEDVFKDLYQNIVTNKFRKAMGEFYTRGWLAKLILNEIDYNGESILDPACGSGAFLTKAINQIESDAKNIPENISKIHGFDLNPVAVAAAKSNVLGSVASHLRNTTIDVSEVQRISFSIYWTNSIFWKDPDLHGNNITLLNPLTKIKFPEDPDEAARKVRDDIKSWGDDQKFSKILDKTWYKDISISLTSPIRCPPFNYVVGNPPWVSPDRVSKNYRDRVKKLLKDSGFLEPFQPDHLTNRFPNKQYIAALPFYEVAMRHYVTDRGKCAYIVTSSVLKSMNSGGFRKQMQEWGLTRVLDFTPYTDIHQEATCWGCIPVISRSSGDSSVSYEYFTPTDGKMPSHDGECREINTPHENFHVCKWEILHKKLPFIPEDKKSPWFTAPPSVVKIYRRMLEEKPYVGENYRSTRGLVTGRNSIYIINEIDGNQCEVSVRTNASDGRMTINSDLVYPFVEGKSLSTWEFDYRYLILPYDVPDWTPIPESELGSDYPKVRSYLDSNKDALETRRTYTISSQIDSGSPYYVVESRDILGKKAVVGVREVAPYLETAVVPPSIEDSILGDCETVIGHTLNFVVPSSNQEAYYLTGIFNSWAIRSLLYDLAQPKGGRPGKRFDMYLISSIPVPEFESSNATHQEIAKLADEAHSADITQSRLENIETRLNELVAEDIYSITQEDLDNLKQHYKRLSHVPE